MTLENGEYSVLSEASFCGKTPCESHQSINFEKNDDFLTCS